MNQCDQTLEEGDSHPVPDALCVQLAALFQSWNSITLRFRRNNGLLQLSPFFLMGWGQRAEATLPSEVPSPVS